MLLLRSGKTFDIRSNETPWRGVRLLLYDDDDVE
jgi:hypothetical protein